MKVIIAGTRPPKGSRYYPQLKSWYLAHTDLVMNAVTEACFAITEVVSGGAIGVDTLAERWAEEHHIPVKKFRPRWDAGGVIDKAAGFKRNGLMADYADALIAIWDGESHGTANMIEHMVAREKPYYVEYYKP